jgi:hypothetical protein
MDFDHGRGAARQRLLEQMMKALESGDRFKVDEALVAANRFLRVGNSYVPDAAVENARAKLKAAHPLDELDTEEDGTT